MSDLKTLLKAEDELYKDYRKLQLALEAIEPAYLAAIKAVDTWYIQNATWELFQKDNDAALTSGSFEHCLDFLKAIKDQARLEYRSASLSSRIEDRFWWVFELSIIKDVEQRYELEDRNYRIAVVKSERK